MDELDTRTIVTTIIAPGWHMKASATPAFRSSYGLTARQLAKTDRRIQIACHHGRGSAHLSFFVTSFASWSPAISTQMWSLHEHKYQLVMM